MDSVVNIPTVAHVIQQAFAPVFLLTGIGSFLTVLTNRLGRIVDRSRQLNTLDGAKMEKFQPEISALLRRARWIYRAISLCTISALSICLSIAILFLGVEMKIDLSNTVSSLFVLAMAALITGLLCFLREITLATDGVETKLSQQ